MLKKGEGKTNKGRKREDGIKKEGRDDEKGRRRNKDGRRDDEEGRGRNNE